MLEEGLASNWTPGTLARNAHGAPVQPDGPDAAAWSIGGAVQALRLGSWKSSCIMEAIASTLELLHGASSVMVWEDRPERTEADVLALIAAARRAAQLGGFQGMGLVIHSQRKPKRFDKIVQVIREVAA